MAGDVFLLTIFPLAMALAAANDLFSMTIPNWISALLVAGFAIAAPLAGLGLGDIGLHAALGLTALVAGFILFSLRLIGGGDAKLCAATCLWMGPAQLLPFAIYAALLGGALTILIAYIRSAPLPGVLHTQGWIVRLHDAKEGVPYGIALAGAGLLAYPGTAFVAGLGG